MGSLISQVEVREVALQTGRQKSRKRDGVRDKNVWIYSEEPLGERKPLAGKVR